MTNKLFSKTVEKTTLMSIILAVILAAAIVVFSLWGLNKNIAVDDYKTVTISMNKAAYTDSRADIIADCENTFDELDVRFIMQGETSGDVCEIIFVFDKKVDVVALTEKIEAVIAEKSKVDVNGNVGQYNGMFIDVLATKEVAVATLAKHFVLRAAIAAGVIVVLSFAYAAIRYKKMRAAVVTGVSVALGMLLTAALAVLTRVQVNSSLASVIALAGLTTAAIVFLFLGKLRSAKADKDEVEKKQLVQSCIPAKEGFWLFGILAVAMLFVGIIGKTDAAWFAVSALFAVLSSGFISLFFAPSLCLSLEKAFGGKDKKGYVGAQKTSTKQKKEKKKTNKSAVEKVEQAEESKSEPAVESAEQAENQAE